MQVATVSPADSCAARECQNDSGCVASLAYVDENAAGTPASARKRMVSKAQTLAGLKPAGGCAIRHRAPLDRRNKIGFSGSRSSRSCENLVDLWCIGGPGKQAGEQLSVRLRGRIRKRSCACRLECRQICEERLDKDSL